MDDASAKPDAPARDPSAEHSLRHALSHNEFVLYGQPILSLQGAEDYTMAEVLVRMSAEEDYLLPPGEFFPAFEHYGLMRRKPRRGTCQLLPHFNLRLLLSKFIQTMRHFRRHLTMIAEPPQCP